MIYKWPTTYWYFFSPKIFFQKNNSKLGYTFSDFNMYVNRMSRELVNGLDYDSDEYLKERYEENNISEFISENCDNEPFQYPDEYDFAYTRRVNIPDKFGYDKFGYDKDGYDRDGYDRDGYNCCGYYK